MTKVCKYKKQHQEIEKAWN